MTGRRALSLVAIALVALVIPVVAGRIDGPGSPATFAEPARAATPIAPPAGALSRTFYCPGVPAAGQGQEGEVIVLNVGDETSTVRVTLLSPDQDPVVTGIDVAPGDRGIVDVDELVTASYVGAAVEVFGGRAVVEQRAIHPAGASIAPCANETSSSWYFADGFTVDGSTMQLVLTNPFPDASVVDISFVTENGPRSPQAFQGLVLEPESVTVLPFGESVARDEPVLALSIESSNGRFVAGRAQHYVGGGRLGYSMTLGAPSLSDQWWFADGEVADGVTEQLVVYNPTEDDVAADVVFLGLPEDAPVDPVTLAVQAGDVAVLDVSQVAGMPSGRHGVAVSTLAADSIVAEQVITRPAGDSVATSVVLGAQSEYTSGRWFVPSGVPFALDGALVAMNATALDGTVTVSAITVDGEVPLPALGEVPIAPGQVLPITLPAEAVGKPLVVTSDVQVVVQRLWPRGQELRGRSVSLAVPE